MSWMNSSKSSISSSVNRKKTQLALPGCLTTDTQDEIKQLIQDRAAVLPREKQAGFVISMWSALGTHFGVKKEKGDKTPAYKRIPEGARLECLSLIARLSADNLVTLTTEAFEQAVQERVQALPAPELSLSTKINELIDTKIKVLQGKLLPKQPLLKDGEMIVSQSALQKALRKAYGDAITFKSYRELTIKVPEYVYEANEKAFFNELSG